MRLCFFIFLNLMVFLMKPIAIFSFGFFTMFEVGDRRGDNESNLIFDLTIRNLKRLSKNLIIRPELVSSVSSGVFIDFLIRSSYNHFVCFEYFGIGFLTWGFSYNGILMPMPRGFAEMRPVKTCFVLKNDFFVMHIVIHARIVAAVMRCEMMPPYDFGGFSAKNA